MSALNKLVSKALLAALLLAGGISTAFAAVSNCRPNIGGSQIDFALSFDITSNTTSIAPGTQLATALTGMVGLLCDYTGNDTAQNSVYFRNTAPANIKAMLRDSGVDVFQQYAVGSDGTVANINAANVPDLYLGSWTQSGSGSIPLRYQFTAKKGAGALKPFDTGTFILGHHVNYLGQNIGAPVTARIIGKLTVLCPQPKVNIAASNGGSVNFGTMSPQQMNSGAAISKSLNLNMTVPPDCESGLNVSVRFDANSNNVLDNKYLDMGNGLQVLLKGSAGDVNYGESYAVGEILPSSPVNLPYTATLTKIPGSTITSGPFSKTIRVIVSY